MSKSISRVLSGILLKTFLISSLLSLLTYQLLNSGNKQSFESKQGDFIESIAGIFLILILTICSLPVYFNQIDKVRKNLILRFLSFFFFPIVAILLFWLLGDHNSEWLSFYVSTGIFLLTLLTFYVLFSKQNQSLKRY